MYWRRTVWLWRKKNGRREIPAAVVKHFLLEGIAAVLLLVIRLNLLLG